VGLGVRVGVGGAGVSVAALPAEGGAGGAGVVAGSVLTPWQAVNARAVIMAIDARKRMAAPKIVGWMAGWLSTLQANKPSSIFVLQGVPPGHVDYSVKPLRNCYTSMVLEVWRAGKEDGIRIH